MILAQKEISASFAPLECKSAGMILNACLWAMMVTVLNLPIAPLTNIATWESAQISRK
jgi:hypothetical protein